MNWRGLEQPNNFQPVRNMPKVPHWTSYALLLA
jgi:hypothetical protein